MVVNFEMFLSPVEILKKIIDRDNVSDISANDKKCSDLSDICRLYATDATVKYTYYHDPLRYSRWSLEVFTDG